MDVKTKLISGTRREDSGSLVSNRFDYQKDWAICQLLEEHENSKDYVLILDFYDDLLILDSERNPKTIKAYQVKTKQVDNWTFNKLTEKKEQKLSILGKLYFNKKEFEEKIASLNLISNARFNLEMIDKKSSKNEKEIRLDNLEGQKLKILEKLLRSELNFTSKFEPNLIYLKVSDLSLDDHSNHVMGKLERFLQKLAQGKYNTSLNYKTLFDEVTRKTNGENKQNGTYEEFLKKKCISKSEFGKMVKQFLATNDENTEQAWTRIENRLNAESFTVQEIDEYRINYRKILVEMTDENLILKMIYKYIKKIHGEFKKQNKLNTTLKKCILLTIQEYNLNPVKQDIYDQKYLETIVLNLIYYGK